MYDTRFFIQSYGLKQDILRGSFGAADGERVFDALHAQVGARPYVFNIETTSHCNMRCVMCQRTTDMTRRPQHMDMGLFESIAVQIAPRDPEALRQWSAFVHDNLVPGIASAETPFDENIFYYNIVSRCVTLHGFGEPLLDPHLPQRVELLTQRGVPSYFSCNPCNIRLDFFKDLFAAKTGFIKFAMDSLDDGQAKKIRGGPADFSTSYEKILKVLELKKHMKAATVIVMTMLDFEGSQAPGSQAARFLDLWQDTDVLAYVKSVDNKWLLKRKGEAEKTHGADKSHYTGQYCEYPWTSMTILADGAVVPCTQDCNASCVLGQASQQTLAEIWQGGPFREFRKKQASGDFDADFMCHARCDKPLICYHLGLHV